MARRSERAGKADWQRIIDKQAGSGLSALAYCDKHSITYSSFIYWRKQLRGSGPVVRVEPEFVELTPPAPAARESSSWLIELDLSPGVQLRIARHA